MCSAAWGEALRRSAAVVVLCLLAACGSSSDGGSTSDGNIVELHSGELTLRIQRDPFVVTARDRRGTLLEQAAEGQHGSLAYWRGEVAHHVVRSTAVPNVEGSRWRFAVETTEGVGAEVVIDLRADGAVAIELVPPDPDTVTAVGDVFVAPAGERYYGLSERIVSDGPFGSASELAPQEVGSLDRRGETVRISVAATISIYAPFMHSSRGYGLFVDGPMQGDFDLARSDPDRVAIRFDFDPTAERFRYHILHGPGHAAILDRYTALSGRPWLPPRWAYRHMRWRDEHPVGPTAPLDGVEMNAALVDDVTMYDALGFPAPGWYTFDRPWSSGPAGACPSSGFSRFEFDPVRFPNAAQMVAALAARGTRTLVWGSPWVCGNPDDPLDNAFDAARNGYLAPNDAIHLDVTNPAAVGWWQDKVGNFVDAMHIAGFKLDRGDETVPSGADDIYFDGRNGRELHNDYPRLYVQTYADVLDATRPGDWVTMTRPGYAGSQARGLYWGGDITGADGLGTGAGTDKGLRSALISLQRLAFMGFPNWGTDTGGYYQFKQRDVFARWLQFSAFCPVMEIGGALRIGDSANGPHAPWAMPTEPSYDPEMIAIYRYYTWLHHELVPYSYSEGVRASRSGHPIATPLVFEYADDAAVADMWDQYLYGPWLLVAPVWRDGARSREVYLPDDAWTDFWDDRQLLRGPRMLTDVAVPLDRIPLYIRLGAILPLEVVNDVTGFGTAASAGRLTLAVYPHRTSRYELHDETGTTEIVSEKTGDYDARAAIRIATSPAARDYLLRVAANYDPSRVTLDGTTLARCADQAELDAGDCSWLSNDGRVVVKYGTSGEAATLRLIP